MWVTWQRSRTMLGIEIQLHTPYMTEDVTVMAMCPFRILINRVWKVDCGQLTGNISIFQVDSHMLVHIIPATSRGSC